MKYLSFKNSYSLYRIPKERGGRDRKGPLSDSSVSSRVIEARAFLGFQEPKVVLEFVFGKQLQINVILILKDLLKMFN